MTMTTLTRTTLILGSALALAACGGGNNATGPDPSTQAQSLTYAYPGNHQAEVAPPSPVVLRFTSDVNLAAASGAVTLHQGDAGGPSMGFTPGLSPDGKGLILTPDHDFKPHTQYTVVIQGLTLKDGTARNQNVTFTTRALQRGPKDETTENPDTFTLARHYPNGSSDQPVMDFSTFRLEFSQPIDSSTTVYGNGPDDTVKLVDSQGNLVPATLLVHGAYMTVDPKPEYLKAGEKYSLELNGKVASTYGDDLVNSTGNGGEDLSFTPKASSPRGKPTILVQKITSSNNGNVLSPLTGKAVNVVPVNGTLLGKDANTTQASANIDAELADATVYPHVLPIRIPKGTVLNGSSIDVKIGGTVPAGISSGAVKMTLLSDATGYMETNPYTDNPNALRIVHLFMDVGISTANAQANGGFTQDLLHVELVGNASVDSKKGVLDLNAVGVVQPNVLGLETGYGTLSFQLQSYADQTNAPKQVADTTAPTIQSWMPGDANHGGDHVNLQKPGDPIVINFDKPIDPQSVQGQVTLYKTDNSGITQQDINVSVDGAAVVIKPKNPLEYSPETNPVSYELQLGNQIADIQGNKYQGSFDQTFSLPEKVEDWTPYAYNVPAFNAYGDGSIAPQPETHVRRHSPFILGLYPGYPCVFDSSTMDLSANVAGRCNGGIPPNDQGLTVGDLLPLTSMPANRPIVVVFSKDMDIDSIQLGKTFQVQTINADGTIVGEVPGTLTIVSPRQIRFWPDQPWQAGQLYRYTLVSNGDITSSEVDCTQAICGSSGLPLQTQLLANITVSAPSFPDNPLGYRIDPQDHMNTDAQIDGGPEMVQYFKGAIASKAVLQVLKTAPISDTNGNLYHDADRVYEDDSGSQRELRYGAFGFANIDPNNSGYDPDNIFEGSYQTQESGPTSTPDPNTQGLTDATDGGFGQVLDPEGVLPAPNSAKILSTLFGVKNIDQDYPFSGSVIGSYVVGASVGCSYQSQVPVPSSQVCTTTPFGTNCYYKQYKSIPAICPKDKFTYLNGVLFAEVMQGTDSNGNIPVEIYPGHVVTTSFNTFGRLGQTQAGIVPVRSGYQVMRMRYAKNSQGERVDNIPASISAGDDNKPRLQTSLDLYLDAPLLVRNISTILKHTGATDNFFSYPTHLNLTGSVSFLNDGRMLIDQHNTNSAAFKLRGFGPPTYVNLEIPKNGSYLQYISAPIKR